MGNVHLRLVDELQTEVLDVPDNPDNGPIWILPGCESEPMCQPAPERICVRPQAPRHRVVHDHGSWRACVVGVGEIAPPYPSRPDGAEDYRA